MTVVAAGRNRAQAARGEEIVARALALTRAAGGLCCGGEQADREADRRRRAGGGAAGDRGAVAVVPRAAPLPEPPALTGDLPPASPLAEMALFHLPTGITLRSADGFAYRGGSFSDRREFTMSAVLVQHPRGDLADRQRLRA